MGLDADFTIQVHFGEKEPITTHDEVDAFHHPMKDGWAIWEHKLHVVRLFNHRIHAWICKHVSMLANDGQEVDVEMEQLRELEHTLKKFATDPEALPACPKELLWGPFSGCDHVSNALDEHSEEQLRTDMKGARQIAKKIRKMRKYIGKETKKWEKDQGYHPIVRGNYRASW